MNLSEKIMMLRKKEGWSQEELANHLQISRQAVSKWESGQSMPDTDKIIQLSQLFHVTTDYLLLDQENEGNIQTGIYLSLTQVQEYLKIRKQSSLKIAFATFFMCDFTYSINWFYNAMSVPTISYGRKFSNKYRS